MNDRNFDSFRNIHASEALIQKALAAPETAERMPAVLPWYRRAKNMAAAASVVLIVTLGITAYFLFRNINPPVKPVDDPPPTVVAATGTNEAPPTEAQTDPVIETHKKTQPPTVPPTDPSVQPNAPSTIISRSTADTTAPMQAVTEAPTAPPVPSTLLTESIPAPTTSPIQAPTAVPTEPATETLPSRSNDLVITGVLNADDEDFHGAVYCRIYDWEQDRYLGDDNPLAGSHRADVTVSQSGLAWVVYRPSDHGITVSTGTYTFVFYNEKGVNLN